MSLSRVNQKRDTNEPEIVAALEAAGCSVDRLPGGEGRPDLLVGYRLNNFLIEVKMPGKLLSPKQKAYHANHQGRIHLIRTAEQALCLLEYYRTKRVA